MPDVNPEYVSTGKPKVGGAVYRAPLATTLPTDASTALDAAFESVGYLSDAGVTNDLALSATEVKAWGGATVLITNDSVTDNVQIVMLESKNLEALKAFYGDANVSGSLSTGVTISVNPKDLPAKSYVFEMVLRDGALKRIVLPNAQVSNRASVVYQDGQPIGYGITLTCMPDTSGNTHYEYIKAAS